MLLNCWNLTIWNRLIKPLRIWHFMATVLRPKTVHPVQTRVANTRSTMKRPNRWAFVVRHMLLTYRHVLWSPVVGQPGLVGPSGVPAMTMHWQALVAFNCFDTHNRWDAKTLPLLTTVQPRLAGYLPPYKNAFAEQTDLQMRPRVFLSVCLDDCVSCVTRRNAYCEALQF